MGDTLTIDVGGDQLTRRPSRDRPEPPRIDPDADQVSVTDEGHVDQHDPHDPETMLAQSQRALQARDAELATSRERERTAQQAATQARNEAARANMGRAGDRAAAVASAIEAAKADQTSAKIAKRTAREAGDLDAEMAADEMLSSALYRSNQATAELAWINQQAKQPPQVDQGRQPQQQQSPFTPEVQQWLADHPQYHTDKIYKAYANAAHDDALRAGNANGSPGYVDFINQAMMEAYGPDHGKGGGPLSQRRQEPMESPARNQTSTAGPSNRGGGSTANSGSNVVQTNMGPLTVVERNGRVSINIPQAARADWEEAAAINQMTLSAYAYEQVQIAREQNAGGNAGWHKGEGVSSR